MGNIKKTVQDTYDLLIKAKADTLLPNWDEIVLSMTAKTQTASGAPREITLLKDVDGNVIGRKCTLSDKWFAIGEFFKGTSVIKQLDQEKARIYTAAKKLEKEAEVIRDEAKSAETPEAKLEVYERYENAIDEAKKARTIAVDTKIIAEESKDGLATIDELAKALGVELGKTANVPKPAEPKADNKASA